jgi:predicted  nucleic acid-binding Zn-ribbon protein
VVSVSLAFSVNQIYNQNNMSRPFKLYRLQQIDSQLDWLHARLKDVEIELGDDSELQSVQKRVADTNQELQNASKALKNAENATQQQRIKIEQTEASLYGGKIRNPKELQDLQNESASLKRYLIVLEERQFEAMLSEEDASTRFNEISTEQEQIQQKHDQAKKALLQEKEKLLKDISRFEEERNAATASVEAVDLALYSRLREKRRGIAVAKVVDRACSACGSTLNAALLSAAHSPNQLNICDTCGRVLYSG